MIGDADVDALKAKILASGVSTTDLVNTAWGSASTYRHTDHRGGANGGRIRLAPQKDWEVNNPAALAGVLAALEKVQAEFNAGAKKVSMADLIVLGGTAAVEKAAGKKLAFTPGRTDATAEMTDAASFDVLEPFADGFRNYMGQKWRVTGKSPEALLVDRAHLLTLSSPEMSVLVAGLRTLDSGLAKSFGLTGETLSNEFFMKLLNVDVDWENVPADGGARSYMFSGKDRASGTATGQTATQVDLVFGHDSTLRAIAEYYACGDSNEVFVDDFCAAWTKVMNLDRFDI
jgi:catalase-peroxidase